MTTPKRSRLTVSAWISAALLALLLLAARPALAHGYVVRAIPENRAVLERAPARVQYWFSEGLERDFSRILIRDQAGNIIAEGGVPPENNALLMARLPANLPDGAYVAELRVAFASDGHLITETRVFFIGQEVGGVAGAAASDQADPVEVLWRGLTLVGSLLLFGVFTLYAGVLLPAWGSADHRAGRLPPRVMRRLSQIVLAGFGAAVVGSLIAIFQQAMTLFNTDLRTVLEQNLWGIVRVGTRFGDLWNARLLLLLLAAALFGAALYFRDRQPELVRPFWAANVWALALVIGTFSAGSHAAGSLLWPWVGVFMDWAHALAVGFWAGGLGALALTLPVALAPYSGELRRAALLAALRRFSRLAVVCLAVVITTGLYSASNWIYTPADLTGTRFGGTLLVKLLLAAGLALVGAAHHIALRPERYRRFEALIGRVQGFVPTLRLEALLAAAVIVGAGALGATPVPVPPLAGTAPPPLTASATLDDLTLTAALTPGGPGINTLDLQASRAGQPVDGLSLRVQQVHPARDWRSDWETAEGADGGLYVTAGADITQAGLWWTLVDIGADDAVQRAAFAWAISDAAAVQTSRPPTLVNIAALAAALLALGWAFYPSARRLYRALDLNPATVTVALGAAAATALFSVIGAVLINQSQAQYEATVSPPPALVNPTLPDADSLARGAAAYQAACIGWDGRDYAALVERLPRTRDEELFAALGSGWRGLPACAPLSDSDRWDVVNYLRTKGR